MILTSVLLLAQLAIPAFPGAQGGGAPAVGGRGGVVCEVTNLNDSGAGSLRACIDASGPRTAVFRTCGLITFLSRAQVSNPFLTIAGQTAPCEVVIGGVNQQGEQIFVSTHDVVVRYLTYDGNSPRPTGPDTGTVCCEMASGNIYNVVWDHITARWVGNKPFPLVSNVGGQGIHNMHIQWSLVYEPNVTHAVGIGTVYVSTGSAMATTDDDAHHNMFVTIDHRLPLNQSGNHVRWVNNLVYNYGMFASLSMGGIQSDFIGNKYVDGKSISAPGQGGALNYSNSHNIIGNANNCDPADPTGDCPPSGTNDNKQLISFYELGNQGRNGATYGAPLTTPTNGVNDASQKALNWQGSESGDNSTPGSTGPMPATWYRSTPLPAEQFPIVADPVSNLDNVLLPTVGNSQQLTCDGSWHFNRDSQDLRIINVYQNRLPDDLFYGQFTSPVVTPVAPCPEDPKNNLPLAYEQKYNIAAGTPSNVPTADGYTLLEHYMNGQGSTPPPVTTWKGYLGADVLPGAKIGAQIVVAAGAGPVRNTVCTTTGGPVGNDELSPQPVPVVGASVTVIGGPSPTCNNNVVYWLVQSGVTPPPTPPTVSCTPQSVPSGGTSQCTSNQQVNWSASAGTITSAGVFTAPTTAGTSSTAVTITGTNPNGAGTTQVTVTPIPPTNFILNCTVGANNAISCTGVMP